MKIVFSVIDKYLAYLFNLKWVSPVLVLFLIMYGSIAAPALPQGVLKYFDMTIVKVFVLAGALIVRNYAPTLSLMIAIVFMITMNLLKDHNVIEMAQELVKNTIATASDAVSDTVSIASDTVGVVTGTIGAVGGTIGAVVGAASDVATAAVAGILPGDERFGSYGESHSTV